MIRDMEYICTIWRERSFSQAAKKLHVSQPALSGTVKKVELQLGISLFDRSTSPISLTEAGEYYVQYAEKILNIKHEMDDHFRNLSSQCQTEVRIGAPSYFCIYVLPKLIEKFSINNPNSIYFVELNASDITSYVQNSAVDMVIDVRKNLPDDIESITLYREHILLAVPAQFHVNDSLSSYSMSFEDVMQGAHLDGSVPVVDLRAFKDEPFILLRKGHDMTRRAMEICREAAFEPNVVAEFDQMLSSFRMVLNGGGVAFVRDGVARHISSTDSVVFYRIDDSFASRDVVLNYRKNKEFSPLAKEFIRFLTSPERCWA